MIYMTCKNYICFNCDGEGGNCDVCQGKGVIVEHIDFEVSDSE